MQRFRHVRPAAVLAAGAMFALDEDLIARSAQTFSGLQRSLKFYSIAFPIYLHYEFVDRFGRPDEFRELHAKYSPMIRSQVLEMRGFFFKAAQLMSTREDFLPEEYLWWTRKMQSEAPVTFGSDVARRIIEEDFGEKLENIFSSIDLEIPIGSASIGQVYRGEFRGIPVAVKIQSPGVESQFRSDLNACKKLCAIALPHLVPSLDEIERQFMTEFDYELEGKNMDEIRNNLMPTWGDKIIVPRVHRASKRVLVMDYIPGKKISDIANDYLTTRAVREGVSVDDIRDRLTKEILEKGLTSGFEKSRMKIYHWSVTNLFPILTLGLYRPAQSVPDIFSLLDTAMRVHGHQIFINRTFNGDPHPGNFIVTPEGKLGLIDFGQVKRLSENRVNQLARIMIALSKDDIGTIFAILHDEMGCRNEKNIPEIIWRVTAFWLDRDTPDITLGMDLHKFLTEMNNRDPQKHLCEDLVMVGRCSIMLRSLGLMLGLRVRTSDYWKSYAEDFLRRS
jgi:aarF domain-containing kinase